jgi:hypothetical protein
LQQFGGAQIQAADRLELRFELDPEQLRQLRDEAGGSSPEPRADDLFLLTRKPFADTQALGSTRPRVGRDGKRLYYMSFCDMTVTFC